MKLLYGTGNNAKLQAMKQRLSELGIEIIGLADLGQEIPQTTEGGNTPLENAVQKALCYYKAFHMPVFSCDSGLYIEDLPEELQPGVQVRRVQGRVLSDEEMIAYYAGLAKQYGNLKARYRNAICLVIDEEHIYKGMEEDMASSEFIITAKPHKNLQKGFPLDSLSIDIKTGKYYYDLEADKLEQLAVEDGFLRFFKNCLEL